MSIKIPRSPQLRPILILTLFVTSVWAVDPSEQAHALIGLEYVASRVQHEIPGSQCINEGGGDIEIEGQSPEEWGIGFASCSGRTVFTLFRNLGYEGSHMKKRVVDSILLPPITKEKRVMEQGDCQLDGKIGTTMFAVVHLGKRDRVDSRNGVLAAWSVDLKAEKIVPIDTKRVVCYRPTPP